MWLFLCTVHAATNNAWLRGIRKQGLSRLAHLCLCSDDSLQLRPQDYLDPGHYSLGVFASQVGNFRKVPQMSPAHAAKQMSSFMRMLLDPERPLTPDVPPPDYSDPPCPTGIPCCMHGSGASPVLVDLVFTVLIWPNSPHKNQLHTISRFPLFQSLVAPALDSSFEWACVLTTAKRSLDTWRYVRALLRAAHGVLYGWILSAQGGQSFLEFS